MLVPTSNTHTELADLKGLTVRGGRPASLLPTCRTIRLLFFARETFPAQRVDVDVLFGQELIGRGHAIDFVMPAGSSCHAAGRHVWHGRSVYLGAASRGASLMSALLRHLLGFWHHAKHLISVSPSDYDAIQVRDEFLLGALAIGVARRRRLKCFFWLSFPYPLYDLLQAHGGRARWPTLVYLRGRLTGWLLYRCILPYCDHAFVQSEQMKREICARGIESSRLTAVPMGVDLSELPRAVTAGRTRAPKEVLLGYLGALDAERRLLVLVDTLADLRRHGIDARLLLVGGAFASEDVQRIRERALALEVNDWIEITGMLPRARALERMREAHIALSPIYPSDLYRVSSPTKLIEYLAMQLPVVANDIPEQKRVLRESRAGVCTPWGAKHFVRGVQWLLRRPRAEWQQMGARGRAWVEAHRTYPRIADELEQRYFEILGAASHR